MTTSNTIGTTVISTAQLIEKAIRRCGLNPMTLTAETVATAQEDLFMLLMSLSNRGINLWCVDQKTIPLVVGQATYVLPSGTLDVLNLMLRTPRGDGTYTEIPLTPLNRDDYASQPAKYQTSATPVNYWFEKTLTPQITLWPIPDDDTKSLQLFRYRQIQDIGDIFLELDIPTRWLEAICWHLALRLSFELPGVSAERMSAIKSMADAMVIEVEGRETDSSPTFLYPNLRGYTR